MAQCPNCKNGITCGCQRRTASDNKQCCTKCLAAYEQELIRNRNAQNLANARK